MEYKELPIGMNFFLRKKITFVNWVNECGTYYDIKIS